MKSLKLTDSEQYVIDQIDKDIEYFISNNLKNLSIKYNVGEATLIRLIKKLEYASLKAMQIDYSLKTKTNELTKIYPPNSSQNITHNVSSFEIYSILESKNIVDHEQLKQVADVIIASKSVVFFGVEASYLSALFLSRNLQKVGINNTVYESVHGCITNLSFVESENSVIIIFCSSGLTKEANEVAKYAINNNIKVVWITSTNSIEVNNANLQKANFKLYHSYHKNETLRFPSISSSSGQMFISNLLFNLILNTDKNAFETLEKSNLILKDWNNS
ncbi:MurR/RpiR family transcriptional regulator [Spiroplasma tabanidicola]|uniref:MurR/RpiR family transcriptional regulator n=1 Tax=Spiroplasma tabanidicola TaxID=324079 RepID=A0A6I6C9M2_9MOLU|nr:MurR/RpiR family transcriptional regulator [Spiroplasma tabanidicola]QGS51625.1 MurR/RpiR family transcriptional regulator [Spiroplasma tabanidicola]